MVTEQLQPARIAASHALSAGSGELSPYRATPHTPPKASTPLGHRASGRLDSGALNPGALSPGGAEQEAYFAELLGHPLERLSKEPELLAEDQKQLRRQTQESAVTNYRAFLATAECAAEAHQGVEAAAAALDALGNELPELGAAAAAFSRSAAALLAAKARNKQLQGAQGPLSEVLEVPALMDTCVRNGHFDEALDLRAFVGTLAAAHGDVAAVARLKSQADEAAAAMLAALLARLRGPVQLPECLRVVGFLRRLAVFDEQGLRAQFLECKEAWLAGQVAELEPAAGGSPPDAYDTLKRLTDVHRTQLADAVNQFRSVFLDDIGQDPMQPGAVQQTAGGGLLFAWAERRIALYLRTLRSLLPQVGEGGQVGAMLDHCMYAGATLARVGLDFRAALPPMFESRILALFTQTVATAVETFAATLETHRWLPSSAAARARRPPAQDGGDAAPGPPYALMDAPPLAVFANGLAAALNELRHCPPLVLQQPVTAVVQDALGAVMAGLAQYGETHALTETGQPLFAAAAQSAIKVLAPHMAASLDRVYRGAGAALRLHDAFAPLAALLASWQPPSAPVKPPAGPAGSREQSLPAGRPTGDAAGAPAAGAPGPPVLRQPAAVVP